MLTIQFKKLTVLLVLFFLFFGLKPVIAEINAPIILKAEIEVKGQDKTLIVSGLSFENTEVLIYIRDEFWGQVKTIEKSFVFRSNIIPIGTFSVMAVARDMATQEVSLVSNSVYPVEIIKKEEPKIAVPQVEEPKEEKKTELIKELKTETKPENKEILKITEEKIDGEISEEAVLEEQPLIKGYEEEYSATTSNKETTTSDDADILQKLEDILEKDKTDEISTDTGMLTETKENISKIKLNVFIFLLFLIAVIFWIIWVNRELIKEKKKKMIETIF